MTILVQQLVNEQVREAARIGQAMVESAPTVSAIQQAADRCVEIYKNGRKILVAGNGGSAADAQHMAAELSGRFNIDRPGLPAIALTANSSAVTAIGNDYGYDKVFSRQAQAQGQAGDLFIGISTSGNSGNLLAAIEECKAQGITTVGITGRSGGKMAEVCDICIRVPADSTARIQECHIVIVHILCAAVEESLFGEKATSATADSTGESTADSTLVNA
ncbi:MAG: D-sedoheptulose 7-phosphate isomerase [Cyanobacteria bacterium P01_D01_bin.36]